MKRVMISELKAHLSELVAKARDGETIVVCDRRTPVALLTPFEEENEDFVAQSPSLPMSAARHLRMVTLPEGVDVLAVLDEIRADRI